MLPDLCDILTGFLRMNAKISEAFAHLASPYFPSSFANNVPFQATLESPCLPPAVRSPP